MNRVAVVVLNWNGLADTTACLESLSTQTYRDFTIILVDNGSTERGTSTFLEDMQKTYGEKLVIIQNKTNRGFAGGVNDGINHAMNAGYNYVALFNNDAVADKGWLASLVAAANDTHAGIVTGLLLHEDGKTIDSTGDWYSTWGLPFPRARNQLRRDAPKSGEVFGVSGGASLYSVELFKDIGLFDETFFAYYEDVDVSFRARLRGWNVSYTDQAIAYHKQGASSSKVSGFGVYQTMKNLPLLYIKNVPTQLLFTIGVRFWFAYTLIGLNAVRKGDLIPALRGTLTGCYRFITHGLVQRMHIQRQRKVASSDIRAMLWHDLPPDQTGLRKLRGFFIRSN